MSDEAPPSVEQLSVKRLPVKEGDWEGEAKRLLKAELARQGVTYKVLARRLGAIGVTDEERAIANRISRGKFAFTFFLQCMRALGVEYVDLRVHGRR